MTGIQPARADLVRAARRGDLEAFAEIVRQERPTLIMAARTLVGDFHEAEDAAHEALVAAHRALPGLKDPESFGPWLSRILTRTALRRRRALARLPRPAEILDLPSEDAARNPRLDRLLAEVERLPENFRVLISLYYLRDHSVREVADALDLTEKRVKSRLFEARKLLRGRMGDE